MSRHQRTNSDLAGLKTVDSLKKKSTRELEQFGKVNKSFSNYDSLVSSKKKQKHQIKKVVGSPLKKLQIHELITDTFKLTKHFYEDDDTGYYNRIKQYLKGEWQNQKKHISQHLNKLPYLEQSMHKKAYPQIEKQIINQWRKSPLLYSLRAFWYQIILVLVIKDIHLFLKHYNKFKQFIGQTAYMLFRGCFSVLEGNGALDIVDKLTDRTSNFIITSTNTWRKIFDKIIFPILSKKIQVIPKCYRLLRNFDLQSLQIKKQVVNCQQLHNMMPKTVEKIEKFMLQHQIYDKIQLLNQIRSNMEAQIKANQEDLIEKGLLKKYSLLDRDDFISCLIYCIVKGEINFQYMGVHVRYFQYLLGKQMSQILSKFSCDSYLTDLQAVYDYLHQWAIQYKTLNYIDIKDPQTPTLINYGKNNSHMINSGKTNKTKDSSGKKSDENSFKKEGITKKISLEGSEGQSSSDQPQHFKNSAGYIGIQQFRDMKGGEIMSAKQIGKKNKIIENQLNKYKENDFNSLNLIPNMKKAESQANCQTTLGQKSNTKLLITKKLFSDRRQ